MDDLEAQQRLERRLLLLIGAFLFINFLALALMDAAPLTHWLHFAAWVIGAAGGTFALNRYLPYRDPLIFPLVMFLSGWGLVIIDRLAPNFADRQTVWLLVSIVALLFTAGLPHLLRLLRAFRYTLLIVGLALLVSTILLGRNPSGFGPELWLGIGNVFFQPSEALKIILVAFLASYLGEQYPLLRPADGGQRFSDRYLWLSPRLLGPIVLMWGVCMVVLVWQRDLGTALVFFGVFLMLLYIASGQTFILLSGTVLMLAAAVAAYFGFDVVQLRIDIWLNPWTEADGRAYQIVQSLMAFGAGSIFGQGVGQGSPGYIPVVHSDFVFAALAEEWGLLGALVVIACIALLVMRGMRIGVMHHERPYYALLATGLSTLLGVQSLLIMGGVLKVLPLTGVTLPYLSYGGSSLLMCFVLAGLLMRLSAEIRE
jgi:cell division protein FtsW (lipid II flippase)